MSKETFYAVVSQRECDDPYYPPYNDVIGYYKNKGLAIQAARNARNRTKKYSEPKDCYYVEEMMFNNPDENEFNNEVADDDEEIFFDENNKNKPMVYLIQNKK
jgi:hypothetical protein